MTELRTHVYVEFANPFLVCDLCKKRVTAYHAPEHCHCGEPFWNAPCEHLNGVHSVCPSWSPVDGCDCLGTFGFVPHPPASEVNDE